jgi:lysophospholipase L1-like esterase
VTPGASPGVCQAPGYAQANPTVEQTLQAQLQAKYGAAVTVTNHGVAGNTIPAALAGDGVNLPWSQQMAQSKARIVVFNFGINDSNVTSGESVAQFQANVSQLIQIAKAAGKTVVVETANPVNDPTRAALPDYVAAGIAAARTWDVNVIDEFGYLVTQPTWPSMLSDNVHPTQAGYNLKARVEFTALDPIVGFAVSH